MCLRLGGTALVTAVRLARYAHLVDDLHKTYLEGVTHILYLMVSRRWHAV